MALVLVVEDDRDILAVVAECIDDCGYRVQTAPHGVAALDAIGHERPDLIFTDSMMPEMDGATLIQHVRQRPDSTTIPIVVVSATKPDPAIAPLITAHVQTPFALEDIEMHLVMLLPLVQP